MPYITKDRRNKYDQHLGYLFDALADEIERGQVGYVNYCISSLVFNLFRVRKSYKRANDLMGVLTGVQAEFYRREVAPYEDGAIERNGDI